MTQDARQTAARKSPAKAANVGQKPPTKRALVEKALRHRHGASLDKLMQLTGWQAHSVRGHLSTLRKAGATIERLANKQGTTAYRLVRPTDGS